MNLKQIQAAVRAGKQVHADSISYEVRCHDTPEGEQWLICYRHSSESRPLTKGNGRLNARHFFTNG